MRRRSLLQDFAPLLVTLALLVAVSPATGEGDVVGGGAQDAALPLSNPRGWEELKEENTYDGKEDPLGKVVRTVETFYLRPPSPSPTSATNSRSIVPVPPAQGVATAPDAHILTSLGRLKSLAPIFNYLIHHPVRALTQYILPFLFRTLYSLSRRLLFLLSYALVKGYHLARLLSTPLLHLGHLALSPAIWAYSIFLSLTPIWASLLAAVLVGSGLGAIAGLATGESTRKLLESVMGGVNERKGAYGAAAQYHNGFGKRGLKSGVGGGASFETISNKGKGKSRMMGADQSNYDQPSYLSTSYSPMMSPSSGGRRPSDPPVYGSSYGGSSYDDGEDGGTDDDAISKTSSRTRTTGSGSLSGADTGGLREGFRSG